MAELALVCLHSLMLLPSGIVKFPDCFNRWGGSFGNNRRPRESLIWRCGSVRLRSGQPEVLSFRFQFPYPMSLVFQPVHQLLLIIKEPFPILLEHLYMAIFHLTEPGQIGHLLSCFCEFAFELLYINLFTHL